MTGSAVDVRGRMPRRAVHLEQFTIGYNVVEGVIAVAAGLAAGSVALVGFGFDSMIEVIAAALVLHRLLASMRSGEIDERRERRTLKLVAVTFFALACYVTVEGIRELVAGDVPDTSIVGIVLTGVSVVVMPVLAHTKRTAGLAMNSRIVVADAAETKLCAWLSVSTCAGLVGYALLGWTWIDPLAGFVIAAFAVKEGREAWSGELTCEDHC